jgi:Zn-dependent protease
VLGHSSPQETVRQLALRLLVLVLSLSVHECAHAWVAHRLGDDTAERQGRLSLSPATHVDIFGTLVVPTVAFLAAGAGFIAWARPTPVNPSRFRRGVDMRRGMALVAVAGPLSNVLLAAVAAGLVSLVAHSNPLLLARAGEPSGVGALLWAMFELNVGLAIFNLLPIPPLDGSRLLPRSFDEVVARIAPFGFLLLIVLLRIDPVRSVLIERPFAMLEGALLTLFRLS